MNFRKIIIELNAAGLSDRKIASLVNVAQPTISRLRNIRGAEPRYSLGAAIVELHERTMQERADAA